VRNTTLAAVLLALLTFPAAAGAQEDEERTPCAATLTVGECFRYEIGEFATDEEVEKVDEETTKATTGAQTASEAVSTAVRDFLPRVGAALILPGVDEDRTGLALRLNRYLGPLSAQIGLDLNKPALYAPLVDSIPESIRAASKERLEGDLEDQDDVTFTLALNLEAWGFGRNLGQYRTEVSDLVTELVEVPDSLTQRLFAELSTTVLLRADAARLRERQSEPECARNLRVDELPLSCFRATFADSLREVLRNTAIPYQEIARIRTRGLRAPAFAALAQLLNNQRQLNGSIKYRHRDDLVGANELTFNGRLEFGGYSLHSLRKDCGGTLTASCLVSTMTEARIRRLSEGGRWWLSADGTWRDEHELALTTDSVAIQEPETFELKLQGGYGRYFGSLREEGTRRPRIDVEVGYVLQREDDVRVRNDRATATLSYTHPFSSTSAGVFGVRWASEPEFLGDVDRNISATLGLTYKLVKDDEK
jgi:hypothetical protein